jgi:hypothetical protein
MEGETVRLKVSMLLDGKIVWSGTEIEKEKIPPSLRKKLFIENISPPSSDQHESRKKR